MANKRISDLPLGSALGTTEIPVMNSGVTQKITLSQLGATNQISSGSYNVTVGTDGVVSMVTARGGIEFGAMPEIGGPTHLHIMRPAGQEGASDLYFGDDYNYVKMPGLYGAGTQGVEIGSSYNSGTVSTWRFGTDGNLTAPKNIILDSAGSSESTSITGTVYDNTPNPFTFRILKSANPQLVVAFADPNFVLQWTGSDAGSVAAATQAPGGMTIAGLVSDDGTYWNFNSWFGLSGSNLAGSVFTVEYNVTVTTTTIETTGTDLVLEANSGSDSSQWKFSANGNLTLPVGGDIVDSSGNSVLGAGITNVTTGNLVVGTGTGEFDGNRIYTANLGGVITLVPDGGAVQVGAPGETGVYLEFQDGTTQTTAYTKTNAINKILWVANSGTDTTATGAVNYPFATIQAAHDYAAVTFGENDDVAVIVAPGAYAGAILTRPRTHITGIAGAGNATRIISSVIINPTTVAGGVYNSIFTLDDLLLAPPTGNALVITGNQQLSLFGRRLKVYTDSADQICLQANNTAAGGIRVFVTDSDIQNALAGAVAVDMSNVFVGAVKRTNVYGGANFAMKFSACTLTLDNVAASCQFTDAVSITNGSVITAGNSTFTNTRANSNGINIAAGTTCVVGQSAFDIPAGTGYAVKGVAGSVFVYANNIIAYGKNNKISSAMTSIPMGTNFTPTA